MDSWCTCTKGSDVCKGCLTYAKDAKTELKPRVDLVPPEAILAIATILAFGAEKHGARSWERGMPYSDNYGALQRHLLKWFSGETLDPETGKSHLHHAATRLFFLIGSEIRGIGTDDRPVHNSDVKACPKSKVPQAWEYYNVSLRPRDNR